MTPLDSIWIYKGLNTKYDITFPTLKDFVQLNK